MGVFSGGKSFRETFPEVEEISLTVAQIGHMMKDYQKQEYSYDIDFISSTYRCDNGSCTQRSGFNIEPRLREVIKARETEHKSAVRCSGYEPDLQRDCWNALQLVATIKYKDQETEEPAD